LLIARPYFFKNEKMKNLILTLFCFISLISSKAQNFDINTLKKVNLNRNKNLDGSFKFITNANDYINFGTIATVTTLGLVKKDKKLIRQGLYLFGSQVTALILTQSLKKTINRSRPAVTYPYLQPYEALTGQSFPSGHTSSAFANAMAVSLINKKWYVIVPAFTCASLVGYSRMHLGVHYPSDVFVGAVLGAGSAWLTKILEKKLFKK
jgi:membrane-associated phospholipid phosphatase